MKLKLEICELGQPCHQSALRFPSLMRSKPVNTRKTNTKYKKKPDRFKIIQNTRIMIPKYFLLILFDCSD